MELIQIDVVKRFISSNVYVKDGELTKVVLLDTETGVVYFNGKYPRYDSNGRIMVIPKEQLPGIIARAKARIQAENVEHQRKYGGPTQV